MRDWRNGLARYASVGHESARLLASGPRGLGALDYIARDNPIAGIEFVSTLKEKCELLAQFTELGVRRDDLSPGIRVFAVAGFGIYYRQIGERVRIERVLHGARESNALW